MLTIEEARQRESLKGFRFPPQRTQDPPLVVRKKSTIKCNLIQSLNFPENRNNRGDTIDTVRGDSREQAQKPHFSDRASINVHNYRASNEVSHASLHLLEDRRTPEIESNCPPALENINLQSKYNPAGQYRRRNAHTAAHGVEYSKGSSLRL